MIDARLMILALLGFEQVEHHYASIWRGNGAYSAQTHLALEDAGIITRYLGSNKHLFDLAPGTTTESVGRYYPEE